MLIVYSWVAYWLMAEDPFLSPFLTGTILSSSSLKGRAQRIVGREARCQVYLAGGSRLERGGVGRTCENIMMYQTHAMRNKVYNSGSVRASHWMCLCVFQAIDSIHQVGVYCLALVPANTLPKTPLGGIHISQTKQLFLEGSLHPCNILMCPHTCVTNLPKPRQKQPGNNVASSCAVTVRLPEARLSLCSVWAWTLQD